MKKSLATGLIALTLTSLSSMAFAAKADAQEPMLLSAQQMDDVTAGSRNQAVWSEASLARLFMAFSKQAAISQVNITPITIIQIGNNNTAAIVFSGNFGSIIPTIIQ